MQFQFEARPTVEALPTNYNGEVPTNCHAIRIRNTSATNELTIDVSGTAFTVAPGSSWGMETSDVRVVILRPFRVQTGTATALVERVFITQL